MRPIQVADASDRQRGEQRDTTLGGCRLREARQMVLKVQGWGSRGARVQPIQVAAASDRRRARQRDTGHGGSGPRGAGVQPIQVAAASDRRRARQHDTKAPG